MKLSTSVMLSPQKRSKKGNLGVAPVGLNRIVFGVTEKRIPTGNPVGVSITALNPHREAPLSLLNSPHYSRPIPNLSVTSDFETSKGLT